VYLIDTSVLVDFFKGKETSQTRKLENIITHKIPFGISAFTYQEILQGAKDENEYKKLHSYLLTQKIYYPTSKTFDNAAYLFFNCRKNGITIRGSIDVLIASIAIENGLILLNSDKDFKYISKITTLEIE
jgi:predicted nucleic acid-binding protein